MTDVFVPPEPRWELKADNILATQLFDTLVPALPQHIERITTAGVEFHQILERFLPVTRQEELLEYERDLREKQVSAWQFLHDWVMDGLLLFVSDSLRLFDALQSRTKAKRSAGSMKAVYERASIAGDRCHCARTYTSSIVEVWEGMGEVVKYYAKHPVPRPKQDTGIAEWVTGGISSAFSYLTGRPSHTSPEDFKKLISLAEKMLLEWKEIHSALGDLSQFFTQLTEMYQRDEFTAEWAASLDVKGLRDRWSRLKGHLESGKKSVKKCETRLAKLKVPLME